MLLARFGQVMVLRESLVVGQASPLARVAVAFALVAFAAEVLDERVEAEVWLRAKPAAKAEPL